MGLHRKETECLLVYSVIACVHFPRLMRPAGHARRFTADMKPRRITILRKGLLVLALPLVYQALFIGLLLKRQSDLNEAQHWAMHTKDVIEKTEHDFPPARRHPERPARIPADRKGNLHVAEMARDEGLLDQQFRRIEEP